jgi:hypothetical protein
MEPKKIEDTVLSGQLRTVFIAITNALAWFASRGRWIDAYVLLNTVSNWTDAQRSEVRARLLAKKGMLAKTGKPDLFLSPEASLVIQQRVAKLPSYEVLQPILTQYKITEDQVTDTVTVKQLSINKLDDLVARGFIPKEALEDAKAVTFVFRVNDAKASLQEVVNEFQSKCDTEEVSLVNEGTYDGA